MNDMYKKETCYASSQSCIQRKIEKFISLANESWRREEIPNAKYD